MVEWVLIKEGEAKERKAQAGEDAIDQKQGDHTAIWKCNRLSGPVRSFRLVDFIEC